MPVDKPGLESETAKTDKWAKQRHEPALEPDLPIIDPHHHLWDDQRGRYMLPEFLDDVNTGHNIIKTVFIDNRQMYRAEGPKEMRSVGEVEFINGIAAMSASGRYGKTQVCAGIVGFADMRLGQRAQPVLEAMVAAGNGRFRGIRHGVASDAGVEQATGRPQAQPQLLMQPAFRQGIACLGSLGLSFDAWMFYPQLPELADALRELPNANVILNHVGGPLGIPPHDTPEMFSAWRENMRALVPFANLSVKVGGLGLRPCGFGFHKRDVPPASEELATAWRPYVETCIELFGVERCMMESNFPADKVSCGYGVLWNAMKRITERCSDAEKLALYRDTAARVYRLSV